MTRLVKVLVAVSALLGTSVAIAQTKDQCVDAFEEGQQLRNAGRLRAATERFALCARPPCPPLVRAECATHFDSTKRDTPTVIVGAQDPHGRDLPETRIFLDGEPLAPSAQASSMSLDPGSHTFRFEHPGYVVQEIVAVIRTGDHNRDIVVRLTSFETASGEPPATSHPESAPAAASAPTATPPEHEARTLGYVIGAAGMTALAVGVGFGISVAVQCGGFLKEPCDATHELPLAERPSKERSLDAQAWIANVGVGVGLVALGASAYLLLRPPARPSPVKPVAVGPISYPSGGGFSIHGAF